MRGSAVLALGVVMACTVAPAATACDPGTAGQVKTALGTFLDGFNSRDAASWAASLAYPHLWIGDGGEPEVWRTPQASATDFDASRRYEAGWDHSVWSSIEVPWCSPDAAYAEVHSLSLEQDGSTLHSLHGIYVLTRQSGRWGVQARFSGLAPAAGELGADAVEGARRALEEYLVGQRERSPRALVAAVNFPFVTLAGGAVTRYGSPQGVRDAVAAAGPDLCGPVPELSDELLSSRALVVMAGHPPRADGATPPTLPNLYVLTDQEGHWGVSGCATFSAPAHGTPASR